MFVHRYVEEDVLKGCGNIYIKMCYLLCHILIGERKLANLGVQLAMPYSVVRLSVGLSEHVMFTSLFMLINTQRHVYIIINKYVN